MWNLEMAIARSFFRESCGESTHMYKHTCLKVCFFTYFLHSSSSVYIYFHAYVHTYIHNALKMSMSCMYKIRVKCLGFKLTCLVVDLLQSQHLHLVPPITMSSALCQLK